MAISVILPKPEIECPFCNGDGIDRCDNPDHGFIYATPGDIGRIGCPICGHDEKHRIRYWNQNLRKWVNAICIYCNGRGTINEISEDIANKLFYQ